MLFLFDYQYPTTIHPHLSTLQFYRPYKKQGIRDSHQRFLYCIN